MQKNVIMSVDHLSKDFVIRGKKLGEKSKLLHALSDVSFDIYEGETLGIIGESGCGKSTLGRCLVKLHKPSAGTITYNGKDLWNLPVYEREAARRDIQMIFQDPYSSLDPRKTASYSIEEAMKVHHIGDTGYTGMALAENIMAYSIAVRGIRHTYHRMAISVER